METRSPTAGEPDKDKFQALPPRWPIFDGEPVDSKAKTGLETRQRDRGEVRRGKKEDRVAIAKPGTDAFASRPDDPGAAKVDATKFDEAIKSIDEFTK